jgi:para-nitrobenzyl esterase
MIRPMNRFLLALLLISGCAGSDDTVTVESGPVKAMVSDTTRTFLAIPYAAPPVGDLRFKAPQPPLKWSGTLANIDWGHNCAQASSPIVTNFDFNEDCLTVNIWTPRPVPKDAPVMVFFHGGAFIVGGIQDPIYDGSALASHGVIVVTVGYRLGPFGFVAHPALAAEDPSGSSGLQGFLDQRAALKWVQRNISAFGGDPKNVTIFGESAGAISVLLHMVSPGSAGLFAHAIVESGPLLSRPGLAVRWPKVPSVQTAHQTTDAYALGGQLVKGLGCDTAGDVLACMRGKSTAEVLAAVPLPSFNLRGLMMQPIWWATLDGVEVPDEPYAMLQRGEFTKVPVLIGTNRDEGSFFEKLVTVVSTPADYQAELDAEFATQASAVETQYPVSAFPTPADAATAVFTDHLFTCDTRRVARAVSDSVPLYRYHFEHPAEEPLFPHSGVTHASELAFVFGIGERLAEDEHPLAEAFQGYWTRFARTGDPNGGGAPAWPVYDAATDSYLRLDTTQAADTGVATTSCNFWDNL